MLARVAMNNSRYRGEMARSEARQDVVMDAEPPRLIRTASIDDAAACGAVYAPYVSGNRRAGASTKAQSI